MSLPFCACSREGSPGHWRSWSSFRAKINFDFCRSLSAALIWIVPAAVVKRLSQLTKSQCGFKCLTWFPEVKKVLEKGKNSFSGVRTSGILISENWDFLKKHQRWKFFFWFSGLLQTSAEVEIYFGRNPLCQCHSAMSSVITVLVCSTTLLRFQMADA
jgi:hypothetical protein